VADLLLLLSELFNSAVSKDELSYYISKTINSDLRGGGATWRRHWSPNRMVEIASIKVENLCYKSRFRSTDFATKLVGIMFLQKKTLPIMPHADNCAIVIWLMVIWLTASFSWSASPILGQNMISIDATEKISAETRQSTVYHVDCANEWELPHRYSSWIRLVRVTAHVRRFLGNLKRKRNSQQETITDRNFRVTLNFAFVQQTHFLSEWSMLINHVPIPKCSSLCVEPYNGRKFITPSWRAFAKRRYRISRKTSHHITEALHFGTSHRTHASSYFSWRCALTLRTLRQGYWIVGCRDLVKAHSA